MLATNRKITLLNINGQVILDKSFDNAQKVKINLENKRLSKGIYFLRFNFSELDKKNICMSQHLDN